MRVESLVLALFLALGGLVPPLPASPPAATNDFCPVTPEEWAEPDISATYRGKTVYFCCKRCRMQFLEDPERYLEKLPQFDPHSHDPGAPPGSGAHDHAHDHGPEKPAVPLSTPAHAYRFAGKLHPLAVHFPIALLLVAFGLELGYLATRRPALAETARVLLPLAAFGAVIAAAFGWAAGAHARYPGDLRAVLDQHRWAGVGTALVAVLAAVASEVRHRRSDSRWGLAFRVLLALACAFVVVAGHLGGTLVFGAEHLQW